MSGSSQELPEEQLGDLEDLLPAGRPLTEPQQIGRGPTIEGLAERLLRGEVKKLYEPRRVGKTTVARSALRRVRASDGIDAEVNLAIHRDPRDVAAEIAAQLAAGMSASEVARSALRRVTDALTSTCSDLSDDAGAILEVIDGLLGGEHSPARVLINADDKARSKLAVFLDEAHVIAAWPEDEQEALGAALRDLSNLGVVIASSERRAFEALSGEGGPLEFVGDRFTLPPISDADWRAALPQRFARIGVPILPGALDLLLERSGGHPYRTMLLACESAIAAISGAGPGGRCSETHVQAALFLATRDESWRG